MSDSGGKTTRFPSLKGKIKVVRCSDTGRVRDHNEDAVISDMDIGLLALADGMGGYNAGEVAAELAANVVTKLMREAAARHNRGDTDSESGLMRQTIALRDAVARANKIIWQTAQTQPNCQGMGTTLATCMFFDDRVSIAHVGDSRVYRLRDDRFEQMTLDHSLLQELVDRGFYSREEAQRSTNKNYVTRALGVEASVDVEVQEETVEPGDIYLLCSDGLSDMVEDEDIHLTISTFSANLQTVAEQLIELANENGGRDNVSVALAEVSSSFAVHNGFIGRLKSWLS
ncbi:MAG: Stp1/IreP family PP2C-type Ser/Thr phosphatase [Gammaproteobacteria bacterium]